MTWEVTSCAELSDNVPVAVNCRLTPLGRLTLNGVTRIDCSVAPVQTDAHRGLPVRRSDFDRLQTRGARGSPATRQQAPDSHYQD